MTTAAVTIVVGDIGGIWVIMLHVVYMDVGEGVARTGIACDIDVQCIQ